MTSPPLDATLEADLRAWEAQGLRRRLSEPRGADFCTNDYLALSRDPRVVEAACEAARAHGAGSRAARLLGGHLPVHARVERDAAEWLGAEAALLFPSGYHANLALVTGVAGADDVLFCDERNHASLIDGARLAHARVEVFRHGDLEDLAPRLHRARHARRRLIVVESVYSMDGSQAPLAALDALAAAHDAWLVVDEAHAGGVHGERGQGLARGERLLARTVTGGKALGVGGAFVAGSRDLVETLLQHARPFVFTTAPPPALAGALAASIAIVRSEPERRARVHAAAARLRAALAARGVPAGGEGAIVPVRVGPPAAAVACAAQVQAAGFDVRAVRPPTVAPGDSGLRLVCHADHDDAQVDAVAAAIADAVAATRPDTPAPTAPPRATPLVVVGTDTDVGKTVVSALLVRAAARDGEDARYWKPIQTGADSDTDVVVALGAPAEARPPVVQLPLPASVDQAAAAAGRRVRASEVVDAVAPGLASAPGARWILETAGGLLVPLNETQDQSDYVARLHGDHVLVARSGLGTLNHTRLTVEALVRRGLALRALFLVGPRHEANERTLRTWLPGVPLHALPLFERLDADALDGWLGGRGLAELLR